MYKLLLILGLLVSGCCQKKVKVQSYAVVKTWEKNNVSIHNEISPNFLALLSNNDTVPCTSFTRIGDTVTYKYYTLK